MMRLGDAMRARKPVERFEWKNLLLKLLIRLRMTGKTKKAFCCSFKWFQLGLNQRPPEYESGAADQLSAVYVLHLV